MQAHQSILSGNRFFEYLLLLRPSDELAAQIQEIKQEFARLYFCPIAKSTRPFIMLAHFITMQQREEKIVQRMEQIANGMAPFDVKLKNFGNFPSHTIHINVQTKTPIKKLVKEVQQTKRLMQGHPTALPLFASLPHVAVAHQLEPWQHRKGWGHYEQEQFTGRFTASHMILVKRRMDAKRYETINRFEFKNRPADVMQGVLFPNETIE